MQIYGIGTDIVKCERIAQMWDEHGETFARKILSEHELKMLGEQKVKHASFLAKRFAAKEAVAKALGTGFRDDVIITQIGIETDPKGKPSVVFYGRTKEYVATLGALDIQISLADESDYVVAFVIILKM
ncbi:MAG TPA: holo-ACP synthase [Gammaproteobacteria bacterium]|nr:holo-ACP synthase [Gammaproteobacteria bacterium]